MMNPNTQHGHESYEDYCLRTANMGPDDSCRPTCAARRNPNAECVCAELDKLEGKD